MRLNMMKYDEMRLNKMKHMYTLYTYMYTYIIVYHMYTL